MGTITKEDGAYSKTATERKKFGNLFGLLGRRTLSDVQPAHSLVVTRGSFLASAHRELGVALVQSQGYVHRSCALLLTKPSGRTVSPGADTPNPD
jgi:hypothetical protein